MPFNDLTSGTETYPAGRYLDLDRTPTGLYVIDFNRAYHPYCYYNPTYDCPVPAAREPAEVPRARRRADEEVARCADALVFDFDGVIVNSEPVHLRAFQAVLAEESVALSAREYYDRYVGLSDRDAFGAVADRGWRDLDRPRSSTTSSRGRRSKCSACWPSARRSFPAAAARIRALAAELPLAVASGALRHEIEQVLDRAGLGGCFTAMVAAGETRCSKPAPDPYALAVARLSDGDRPSRSSPPGSWPSRTRCRASRPPARRACGRSR